MADYFPLVEGLALDYCVRWAAGGGYRFEVVSSAEAAGTVLAHCRRTPLAGGPPADFTVRKDARGVFLGRELLLPLPPEPGRGWESGGESCRVESLDAVKTVPAGTFRGCLRVVYLIAGGDGGGGERIYAPGVGLVSDLFTGESESGETVLTRASLP